MNTFMKEDNNNATGFCIKKKAMENKLDASTVVSQFNKCHWKSMVINISQAVICCNTNMLKLL